MSEMSRDAFIDQKDLFISGKEGYHTYRIPSLVVSNSGTVLAFCEGRKEGKSDHGNIHIMLKRSFDGGQTWEKMQKVWSEEQGKQKITCGNPTAVVDRDTGTIWLLFCRNNNTVWYTYSEDDGASWNNPVEITSEVKKEDWTWYATGPGHGIQLAEGDFAGRLIIPCNHTELKGSELKRGEVPSSSRAGAKRHCHIIYSDDHGQNWKLGESTPLPSEEKADEAGVYFAGNECVVVETGKKVYLNTRGGTYPMKCGYRKFSWSYDGGESWEPLKIDNELIEPCCHAGIVGGTQFPGDKDIVLFANPANGPEPDWDKGRKKMTVRASFDNCQSWPLSKMLHKGPSSYADLTVLNDGTILCLYEGGKEHRREWLRLARFNLAWLKE